MWIYDRILLHFDQSKPPGINISSKALSDGSAKPIAFPSRTVTTTQNNYWKINKETTAIY